MVHGISELYIQCFTDHVSRIVHMSPLWGFGYLVCAVFYKHAAPLGLNAAMHPITFHVSQKSVQSKIYVNRSLRLCSRF